MTTLLTKDVIRETYGVTDWKGRKVIVTLKAGDMLKFRVKGKRTKYTVTLASCMNLAFIQSLEDDYKRKMIRYNQRKNLGQRTKKPKDRQEFLVISGIKH